MGDANTPNPYRPLAPHGMLYFCMPRTRNATALKSADAPSPHRNAAIRRTLEIR